MDCKPCYYLGLQIVSPPFRPFRLLFSMGACLFTPLPSSCFGQVRQVLKPLILKKGRNLDTLGSSIKFILSYNEFNCP